MDTTIRAAAARQGATGRRLARQGRRQPWHSGRRPRCGWFPGTSCTLRRRTLPGRRPDRIRSDPWDRLAPGPARSLDLPAPGPAAYGTVASAGPRLEAGRERRPGVTVVAERAATLPRSS